MNKHIGSDFDDFLAEQGILEEINFDLERMEKAIAGDYFVVPEGMTREEFLEWMRENAK